MRPEKKNYFTIKKILFTSVFTAGELKWNSFLFWYFDPLPLFLWNTVFTGPDVSFWASGYITFVTGSKVYFCQNACIEITSAMTKIL